MDSCRLALGYRARAEEFPRPASRIQVKQWLVLHRSLPASSQKLVMTLLNSVTRLSFMAVRLATTPTPIMPAIRPYSIAVAPLSSDKNSETARLIIIHSVFEGGTQDPTR